MWAAFTLGCFFGALVFHAVLCNLTNSHKPLGKFLLAGVSFGLFLSILLYSRYGFRLESIAGLLVFAFASEFYIFLFSMVSTSISVRLLVTLGAKPLDPASLRLIYSGRGMVHRRLEDLSSSGMLERSPEGYCITPKGARMVQYFRTLRIFFNPYRDSPL